MLEHCTKCLPQWLSHFAFSSAINRSTCYPTSLSELGIIRVLDFGPSICASFELITCDVTVSDNPIYQGSGAPAYLPEPQVVLHRIAGAAWLGKLRC